MDQQVILTDRGYKSIMRNDVNTLREFNIKRLIDAGIHFADLSQALIDYNNLAE